MKNQVMFALLALLVANVKCAVIEPVELREIREPAELAEPVELEEPVELIKYNEEVGKANEEVGEPVQIIESFEEVGLGSETSPNVFAGIIETRNGLLFRGIYRRSAVSNTVLVHRVTYRGRASTRISSVRAWQIGSNLGATARVVSGGSGRNFVTVEFRSVRGRGFHIQLEVLGRY